MKQFTSTQFGRRRQLGMTLLEVLVSLSIIAMATAGLNQLATRFSDDTKNTVAAGQMRTFGEAAKAYIKDNYAAVQGVATATTPALIDVPTLIAAGNLTAGFQTANAFGQNVCALVLQPTANRLQAMVVGEDGSAIDDVSLGNMAATIGGSGGGVYASDAATIRGAIGGWTIPVASFDNKVNNVGRKCNGAAGNVRLAAGRPTMALWFENGDASSAFVYRDPVPGHPELNTMNTPLVMAAVQTISTACTTTGAIARDATGAVLSCQAGLWKSQGSAFWQDPVATYATLPACAAGISGQTRIVNSPTVGTGPRAYTCDGTTWVALAVDNSGNLNLPGTITTGKVQINDVVVAGAACPTNGLIAKDGSGLILSCQSGAWDKTRMTQTQYGSGTSFDSGDISVDFGAGAILLAVSNCHTGARLYGTPYCSVAVDGGTCAWDRGYTNDGSNAFASAACSYFGTGTHVVRLFSTGADDANWRYQLVR